VSSHRLSTGEAQASFHAWIPCGHLADPIERAASWRGSGGGGSLPRTVRSEQTQATHGDGEPERHGSVGGTRRVTVVAGACPRRAAEPSGAPARFSKVLRYQAPSA
jgi:hypothetical protein